jgi:hypothetical protein
VQRKKNIQLLVSLSVMILAIALVYIFNPFNTQSSVDKTIFQIPDLEKIDRVVLQSSHEKTELKFNGTKWLVNGFDADPQLIKVLFATLKQTEAKRKAAAHQQDSLQEKFLKDGTNVSCFEGDKLIKKFWSWGDVQKSETYFGLSGEAPYLVVIPGYRVFIASVFALKQNDWRNKRLFNFNWQNIKSLEVNFSADQKQNFKASFSNGIFGIEGIKTDTTKLDVFMDALFELRAEKILTAEQIKKYDSLLMQNIAEHISITDIGNQKYELSIFPLSKGSAKLVAKRNEDVVEINPLLLREIFRTKDYFKLK